MRELLLNVIVCSVVEMFVSVLMPEGDVRKMCMSVIGVFLFGLVVFSLVDIISYV